MGRRTKTQSRSKSAAERRILDLARNPPNIDLAIQFVAEELLKEVPHPPTDLEVLAHGLKVSGFDAEPLPISGELRQVGNRFRVIYSSYLQGYQRRFTIAHELGHAVFAMSGPKYPRGGIEVERICDKFAAEFLMPTTLFKRTIGPEPTSLRLLELSNIFKAPLQATALRVVEFTNLSVFMMEDQEVIWSYGMIRKGPFHNNTFYLKDTLEKIAVTQSGDTSFPISGEIKPSEVRVNWVSLTNGNQKLCTMRKIQTQESLRRRAFELLEELRA